VADALTPPFALAAIVLCVAGVAKLRSPAGAAAAVSVSPILIRVFALAELALGGWAIALPSRLSASLLSVLYACFAVVALMLARRHTPCGCFGEQDRPASGLQSLLSAGLAAVAAVAADRPPHGIGWLFARSPVLWLALAGAVYAVVLAYTTLPAAWTAWEGRAQ
jgi:hypothetical protein